MRLVDSIDAVKMLFNHLKSLPEFKNQISKYANKDKGIQQVVAKRLGISETWRAFNQLNLQTTGVIRIDIIVLV